MRSPRSVLTDPRIYRKRYLLGYSGGVSTTLRANNGGQLIRSLRTGAGLTQQGLADRLNRPQPMIARWERGHDSPRLDSLVAVARACGMELDLRTRSRDDVDRSQIRETLRLTPIQRLQSVENLSAFVRSARRNP